MHGSKQTRSINSHMKNTRAILAVLAAATSMLITGCGSTIPVSAHHYPPVSVESVQLLYQEPARPYEVLALVGREGNLTPFVADVRGLRIEASRVGADAVIVTGAQNTSLFGRNRASGKAIKWVKREEVRQ